MLSRAVAADELEAAHALRILRHQLRVMNVDGAIRVLTRSEGAQAVIDRYDRAGRPIPKNGSSDALHCDHVHALTAGDLTRLVSVEQWIIELPRLGTDEPRLARSAPGRHASLPAPGSRLRRSCSTRWTI